jgi:hypothetical protein
MQDCRPPKKQSLRKLEKKMKRKGLLLAASTAFAVLAGAQAQAWDHPAHMTTAAIAFEEIERLRPDLIDKIGLLLMKHPDSAPFWVAATDETGKGRARRMFIESARWADDAKGTGHDRPTYHTARFPIVEEDAPAKTKELIAARRGEPVGDAIKSLELHARVLANPEANVQERALALSWVMHIIGDIHQPMHVADLFNSEYPTGNAAGSMSYVWDPLKDSAMPLHILWDSNSLRSTQIEDINSNTKELMKKYPRSYFPQLKAPTVKPDFKAWALEGYQVAVDFAYGSGIETVSDPDQGQDTDQLVKKMVMYILEGVSPVKEAPKVPAKHWEKLQDIAHSRITLAGYRMADLIVAAGDQIFADRSLAGKILDNMQRHGTPDN